MRVIAGVYRSRPLTAPRGMETRPTSDRLRETLFSILAPRMEGCHFLDLYAGSGAVGIEAISRGAEHVWFVENRAAAIKAIRANLMSLNILDGYTLETHSASSVLERMPRQGAVADIVFLDPPYEAETEYLRTLEFFGNARGAAMLSADALVIAEHSSRTVLPEQIDSLQKTRVVKQGDAALSFFTRTNV